MPTFIPTASEGTGERTGVADLRNAILCGLAVVAAIALTFPISNSAFNDDWSYSFTVKRLLETGKLTYNGWASASLIAQAYWGLLWVKVFGYSAMVLRFSTIPLAATAISICYLLGRHAGLQARSAVFAALMVGLSPLYLPVANSFMTDAPGLLFIFLSLYFLLRAIEAERIGIAQIWLIAGLITGYIGGTGRQIVWVVPLVIAPYAAWLRRDQISFVLCALVGWALVFTAALLTLYWFNHQPYAIPEASLRDQLHLAAHKPAHFILSVLAILLTTIWVMIPALWGNIRQWTFPRAVVAFLVLIGPVLILGIVRPHYAIAPWMGNTLSSIGVMGTAELSGKRAVVLPFALRIVTAVIVFVMGSILVADLFIWLARPLTAFRKTVVFFLHPDRSRAVLPALVLFAGAYFALLLPRCAADMVYDRYILPLMPCMLFPLLLKYQNRGDMKVPRIAWLLLGIFTLYAIAITQEVTALGKARETAANRLLAAGFSRTQIDAGFEFDFQTQLQNKSYINDPRIKQPPTAHNKKLGPTYSVQPIYRLEFAPATDTVTTPFGSVSYFTYLYPFHRKIYIDRFTDPWWLDPHQAATRPADSRHQLMPSPDVPDDATKN